jgi:hypothetical protein
MNAEPPAGARPNLAGRRAINTLLTGAGAVAALLGLGLVGLRVPPAAFAPVPRPATPPETVPIPAGLPAPVERFIRQTYGDRVPVVKTAVVTGEGTMRVGGIAFPARFRFTHLPGKDYRHYIELTVFGRPVMKVNEYYVGGKERMELPMGVEENNPRLDQGGFLGMWAELIRWLPAALVTDPQVRWQPVDDTTAWLVVPFEAKSGSQSGPQDERILLRFDPESGKVQYMEAMRYKGGAGGKVLWLNGAWADEGSPWFVVSRDEVAFNVDVDVSFGAKGP